MSPYNIFDGNPVYYADPSGADSGGPGDGKKKDCPDCEEGETLYTGGGTEQDGSVVGGESMGMLEFEILILKESEAAKAGNISSSDEVNLEGRYEAEQNMLDYANGQVLQPIGAGYDWNLFQWARHKIHGERTIWWKGDDGLSHQQNVDDDGYLIEGTHSAVQSFEVPWYMGNPARGGLNAMAASNTMRRTSAMGRNMVDRRVLKAGKTVTAENIHTFQATNQFVTVDGKLRRTHGGFSGVVNFEKEVAMMIPSKSNYYTGGVLNTKNSIPMRAGHRTLSQMASLTLGGKATSYAGFALYKKGGKWTIHLNFGINKTRFGIKNAPHTIPADFHNKLKNIIENQYKIKVTGGFTY
jgi:hypothetical protein